MLRAALQVPLPGGFTVDVDLSAEPGITILFGASGSGKTTVLRTIAGFVTPASGRIDAGDRVLFDSNRGVNLPVHHRRVGYVGQDLALFPHLTVEENIGYGLAAHGAAERGERVREMLELFRIGGLRGRRPGRLSGGEQQRVALARCLVTEPRVLLLDEPLSALDHATQTVIMDDLRAWNRRDPIPIIYVTHSHREAFELGQQMVVMDRGRIVARGTPHDVLDAPARFGVANIAGFENVFRARVRAVDESQGTMTCVVGAATEIEVPFSGASAGDEVQVAVRAGDVLVATERPRHISARNILEGTVEALERRGATVIARIAVGAPLEVHLTPGACESLELAPGRRAWAVIKTYSWRVLASLAILLAASSSAAQTDAPNAAVDPRVAQLAVKILY
jgi:molybdate transport system ATP-binding protein